MDGIIETKVVLANSVMFVRREDSDPTKAMKKLPDPPKQLLTYPLIREKEPHVARSFPGSPERCYNNKLTVCNSANTEYSEV